MPVFAASQKRQLSPIIAGLVAISDGGVLRVVQTEQLIRGIYVLS
jgi:hypothetical protein